MTKSSPAVHGMFTIVRDLPHAAERVYAAWSDPTGSLMDALAKSLER